MANRLDRIYGQKISSRKVLKFIEENFTELSGDTEFTKEFRDTLKTINSKYYDQYIETEKFIEITMLDMISHSWMVSKSHIDNRYKFLECTKCHMMNDFIMFEPSVSFKALYQISNNYNTYVINCDDELIKGVLHE